MSARSTVRRVRAGLLTGAVALASLTGVATAAPVGSPDGHPWVLTDRTAAVADPGTTAVDCGGAGDCWAVEGGLLLQSDDLGATWADRSAVLPAGTSHLDDLACPAVDHCRITVETAAGPVLLVVDGAQAVARPIPVLNGNTRLRLSCSSTTRCLVAGYGSVVVRTADAGLTWATGDLPRSFSEPSISCVPGGTFCLEVGNNPAAARSRDGGRTWEKVTLPTGIRSSDDVDCVTAAVCWIATGGLLSTVDGGNTWTTVSLPPAAGGAVSIACVSPVRCRTAGLVGPFTAFHQIGATTTDGLTWTADTASVATALPSPDVACVGALRCLTVWAGTARRTSLVPRSVETGLPVVVGDVAGTGCLTVGSCVAVGSDVGGRPVAVHGAPGTVAVTLMPAPVERPDLIDCVGRSTCTVLASGAPAGGSTRVRTVWRTGDGGVTWANAALPAPATGTNRGLSCPSSTVCLAVGRLGTTPTVARTTDGATWSATPAPTDATDLSALSCASPTSCVVLGARASGSTAWRTSDLGSTWTAVAASPVLADTYDQLACWNAVCLAASDGLATTARSTDGGATWTRRTSPDRASLFSLTCTAQGRCAAVAASHGPAVSTNGGLTWRVDSVGGGSLGCVDTLCVGVAASPSAGLFVYADGLPAAGGA